MNYFKLLTSTAGIVLAYSDAQRTFEQLCFENGYAAESYSVVTEDGYVS